jgi:agmatine deiminase
VTTPHRYSMPPEWAPHERCWMAWPCRAETWGERMAAARRTCADIAQAIAQFEPVTVIARPELTAEASLRCGRGVSVVTLEHDDAWMRDLAPTFVFAADGALAGIDWRFDGYGGRLPGCEADARVAAALCERLEIPRVEVPVVVEGGAIHVDGEGTCLTTEECLLNRNRNPHLRRDEIERGLRHHLGVEKVVWLGRGVHVDETDGHVDNLCAFVRPGVVVLTWTDDERDPQHAISLDARRRLEVATDARGRPFEVHFLHQPGPLYIIEEEARGVDAIEGSRPRLAGDRMAGSYVNFYVANDRVIVPLLDERHDDAAAQTLEALFPERRIVGVPGREILQGGGNVHCITQQVPRARTLPYSEPSPPGA